MTVSDTLALHWYFIVFAMMAGLAWTVVMYWMKP